MDHVVTSEQLDLLAHLLRDGEESDEWRRCSGVSLIELERKGIIRFVGEDRDHCEWVTAVYLTEKGRELAVALVDEATKPRGKPA